jgi:hypothetical protein
MSKNFHNISKENNYKIEKPKEIIPIYLLLFNFHINTSNKTNIEAQIIYFKK